MRLFRFFVLMAAFGLATVVASAQAPAAPPTRTAPVPTQIGSAKKVFVSNSGDECLPFGKVPFSGGPDRTYEDFYASIKGWGRHTLVGTPSDADLVYEIHFQCPIFYDQNITRADPQLRLVMRDPKSGVQLWAIIEHFNAALLKGNRDKDLDNAMKGLVEQLKDLTTLSSAAAGAS